MTSTASADVTFPEPGKMFAERYRIERLLGEGGHSRVYEAVQRDFDRVVAVKVLDVQTSSGARETMEQRFYREARLLSRLRGPHTLTVYDYGRTDSGQLFMVSELVPGADLREMLQQTGALSDRRAHRIFVQILQGLMEVHAEGFLHRDIKPSNVMVFDHLGQRDQVKLLDFGIAKSLSEVGTGNTALTRVGFVIGTPGYMSPEQAFGEEMLESSDVYSAALVAFEMLTGRAPFKGMTFPQMQSSLRAAPLRLPGTLEVSNVLADVIHRCLETDPAKRYASAAEALRDLGVAPDTLEMAITDERVEAHAANVLTFPMHFDFTGTTRIDTLTDAQTGETTVMALPDSEPRRIDSKSEKTPAASTLVSLEEPTFPARLLLVLALLLAALVGFGWWAVTRGDTPVPAPTPGVEGAVDTAAEILSRSLRNAELDARIAAKEAALEAEQVVPPEAPFEDVGEELEFELDREVEPEPDVVEPEQRPTKPTPEAVKPEPDRKPERQLADPEPEAAEREKPEREKPASSSPNETAPTEDVDTPRPKPEDFDVKMVDEL